MRVPESCECGGRMMATSTPTRAGITVRYLRCDSCHRKSKRLLQTRNKNRCVIATLQDTKDMSTQKLEIDISTIRRLTDIDTGYLMLWCERQCDLCQFTGFARWLHEAIGDEVVRRADPAAESSMLSLPSDWTGQEISDAMLGSYVLTRHPCTEAVAVFADELHLRCLTYASAVVQELQVTYR